MSTTIYPIYHLTTHFVRSAQRTQTVVPVKWNARFDPNICSSPLIHCYVSRPFHFRFFRSFRWAVLLGAERAEQKPEPQKVTKRNKIREKVL